MAARPFESPGVSAVDDTQPRSRRSILAAGLGAAGGAVAVSLGRPFAADATVATMQTGTDNTSDATTRLLGPTGATVVLGVAPTSMTPVELGGETVAIGTDKVAWPALNVVTTSDDDGLGMKVAAEGTVATGIRVVASQTGIESVQQNEFGSGVRGEAHGEQAVGVRGEGVGLATGGVFGAEQGSALIVNGRAKFSRSGRALVPKGRSYVDITVPGGLSSTTSSVLATIQGYSSGAAVSGVRPNYPSSGKARIYLTKIVSKTASTPVGWMVIG
jgi:hypothetical protein